MGREDNKHRKKRRDHHHDDGDANIRGDMLSNGRVILNHREKSELTMFISISV